MRLGPDEPIWIAADPTLLSTLVDILFETTVRDWSYSSRTESLRRRTRRSSPRGRRPRSWLASGSTYGPRRIGRGRTNEAGARGRWLFSSWRGKIGVEAIVRGEEPTGMSQERLTKGMPIGWEEQRESLQFRPEPSAPAKS